MAAPDPAARLHAVESFVAEARGWLRDDLDEMMLAFNELAIGGTDEEIRKELEQRFQKAFLNAVHVVARLAESAAKEH